MKNLLILFVACVLVATVFADPHFLIDDYQQWDTALGSTFPDNHIRPMSPTDWTQHMNPWFGTEVEGPPYLFGEPVNFLPCEPEPWKLYPHNGSDYGDGEPGLVMAWGDESLPQEEGNYASGWKLVYGLDPDLSNSMVKITVNPPPPPVGAPAGAGITAISFAFVDVNGLRRVWWWSVPAPIAYGPTPVTIDGSMTGIAATNPPATGYANAPGFDITKVVSFDVDENFNYIFGTVPVPPPGQQQFVMAWNYWHNLLVTNKDTRVNKGIWVKFSQPPEVISEEMPPQIKGWDVHSVFPWNFDNGVTFTMAADDWVCKDPRPVTDVHWWGSFVGWTQPTLPPQVPDYFLMMIWRDIPAGADGSPSRPSELLWVHQCKKWVWNFAGYDIDPRWNYNMDYDFDRLGMPQENESCFQFNQLLSEDDWFYQEPMDETGVGNVYWLGIAAVYTQGQEVRYPWGWKTKPYDPSKAPDAAVVIQQFDQGTSPTNIDTVSNPGVSGHVTTVAQFFPIILPYPSQYPNGEWFDLAFELTTNQKEPDKCYDLQGDINHNCIVDLSDFALLASDWLKTTTP